MDAVGDHVYGYTKSDWVCDGGSYNKTAGGVETIQVGLNGEATCTITNDDKPGTTRHHQEREACSGVPTIRPLASTTLDPGRAAGSSLTVNGDPDPVLGTRRRPRGGRTVDQQGDHRADAAQVDRSRGHRAGRPIRARPCNCVVHRDGWQHGRRRPVLKPSPSPSRTATQSTCTFENTGRAACAPASGNALAARQHRAARRRSAVSTRHWPGSASSPAAMNKTRRSVRRRPASFAVCWATYYARLHGARRSRTQHRLREGRLPLDKARIHGQQQSLDAALNMAARLVAAAVPAGGPESSPGRDCGHQRDADRLPALPLQQSGDTALHAVSADQQEREHRQGSGRLPNKQPDVENSVSIGVSLTD